MSDDIIKNLVNEMEDDTKAGETPHDRFKRIANFRMAKAVERMRMLHNLGNGTYDYTSDEAEFIVMVLSQEVKKVKEALLGSPNDIPQL